MTDFFSSFLTGTSSFTGCGSGKGRLAAGSGGSFLGFQVGCLGIAPRCLVGGPTRGACDGTAWRGGGIPHDGAIEGDLLIGIAGRGLCWIGVLVISA